MFQRLIPLLAIALALVACSASSSPPQTDPRVRLMSFNIRYPAKQDGDNHWRHRAQSVGHFLQASEPDILGVQEATPGQARDLDGFLGLYTRLGEGRDGQGHGEACYLYYRSDRFEALASETFWLSPTPEKPSMGWDAALRRVATWARLKDRATGQTFTVMNTHFDHRGAQARQESAALLIQKIDAVAGGGPVVLMGDFNVTDAQPPYAVLTRAEGSPHGPLIDSRKSVELGRFGPDGTFVGFDGLFRNGKRIDFVFTRGPVRVLFEMVFAGLWNERHLSDHRPLMVELLIGGSS